MRKHFCDRCKKEVQEMELVWLDLEKFYIKPPFPRYQLCGQCQMDVVKHLTELEISNAL